MFQGTGVLGTVVGSLAKGIGGLVAESLYDCIYVEILFMCASKLYMHRRIYICLHRFSEEL